MLNVNVPNLPVDHIRGVQLTRLGHRSRAAPVEVVDPRGRSGYWIAAAGDADDCGPGTDFHAVMQGYVSITPLQLDRTFNDAFASVELAGGAALMAREQDDMLRRGIGMTSQRTRERLIQRLYEEGLSNAQVLEVIRRTPRHLFVDEALAHRAYEDTALPIGRNQTISQPYMVARMMNCCWPPGLWTRCWKSAPARAIRRRCCRNWWNGCFPLSASGLQDRAKERLVELNCETWCSAGATAGKGGRRWHRITALSSLRWPLMCRRPCSISWPLASVW